MEEDDYDDYFDEDGEDEWPEEDPADDYYDDDYVATSSEDSEGGQFLLLDARDYDTMMQPGAEVSEENLEQELGVYYIDRQNKKT